MKWNGIFVAKHHDVYEPSDDTFVLAEQVQTHIKPGMNFLEVGCGAGLVSMVAAKAGATVTCTDLNPHAVALTTSNAKQNGLKLDVRETDLMAGIEGPFDIIVFNPPYLPTAPEDHVEGPLNLAFDGGLDGNREVLRFVAQLAIVKAATVLVIHSSLSDPQPLIGAMAKLGYQDDVAAEVALPYERLFVRRFRAG